MNKIFRTALKMVKYLKVILMTIIYDLRNILRLLHLRNTEDMSHNYEDVSTSQINV